jgi:tungstate transport system substrate-binding protein
MRAPLNAPTQLAFSYIINGLLIINLVALGCRKPQEDLSQKVRVLRLATTTSARDSGLLDVLLPVFEQSFHCRVDVIAVGSGAALQLGKSGDADAVLVHARAAEDAFMQAGYGTRHEEFMKNDFVILGPQNDPAQVQGLVATEILQQLATGRHLFVSRGDRSGTHQREEELWKKAGVTPNWESYVESGQGMGATLTMANELNAYILCDFGTYINFKDDIDLVRLNGSPDGLENPYACMVVNPALHPHTESELAHAFVDYLISNAVQEKIANYRIQGTALFTPTRQTDTP